MNVLHSFLADLGGYGGLLLGAPLVLIGLAMRGLARQRAARMTIAARARRRIGDVIEPGPVALVGVACVVGARLLVEDPSTHARLAVEHDGLATPSDGELVLVYGAARLDAGAPDAAQAGGYRGDARGFVVDARGEEHFLVPHTREPVDQLPFLHVQALAGALIFTVGVLLATAASAVALSLSR